MLLDENTTEKIIGRNIRARRVLKGWTQEQLGRRMDFTCQQMQKYESGKNSISAAKLWKLSILLECPVAGFFASPETPPPIGRREMSVNRDLAAIPSKAVRDSIAGLLRELARKPAD